MFYQMNTRTLKHLFKWLDNTKNKNFTIFGLWKKVSLLKIYRNRLNVLICC